MRPLVADGGELTVLRSLAAYSYGQWSVEWPDSVPEEQRPELPDEREFGYVARLDVEPGRMGRRFVRADVSITAAEYTPEGKVIPYSGFSDVEQVIDEAASRTTGDVFFEREIERAGLNGNIPYVDFDVDDLVPVTLWGKSTIVPVTSIQEVTEAGEAVGWRVRVGGDLIADDVARERANRDIEAAIAQERRERQGDVAKVSAAASVAQSTADTARDEVAAVRDTLAGEQAQEPDLLSQLVAVNDELQRLGQDPQPSLMLAFVSLSTALWEAQQEWNREREAIDSRQDEFAADLQEQIRMMEAIREEAERRRPRPVFAKFPEYKDGYVDPEGLVRIEPFSVGDRGFVIQCLGEWTGTMVVRATAIAPLSANSIDSVRASVSVSQRRFTGVPEAVQMSYNTLDLTIYQD